MCYFFMSFLLSCPVPTMKYITMKNVVLYIALYFISTTFMTLKFGRASSPLSSYPPAPLLENLLVVLTSCFSYSKILHHDLGLFLLVKNLHNMNFLSVFTHHFYEALWGTKYIQISWYVIVYKILWHAILMVQLKTEETKISHYR